MSKVIIFPHESLFAAGYTPAAVGQSVMAAATLAKPKVFRDALKQRHQALTHFAALTSNSAKAVAYARRKLHEAAEVALPPVKMAAVKSAAKKAAQKVAKKSAPKPKLPRPLILDAIGAIIMDADMVDKAALESAYRAVVVENFAVALRLPGVAAVDTKPAAELQPEDLWHLDHVNIKAARDQGLDGKGVLVGVLDTGIDPDHPEFAGKKLHFAEFDQDGERVTGPARDAASHGTHVSALIAGKNAGIAPAADLAVAAVLTYKDQAGRSVGYFAQILAGMNWLLQEDFGGAQADPGVHVMNASLTCTGTAADGSFVPYNPFFYPRLAEARAAQGTLMIAAIGNNGSLGKNHHGSPGNYDITLGVGAVNNQSRVADFSDWGTAEQHGDLSKPDFAAPGEGIWSAFPGGIYGKDKGTSMAAPLVTGAAALLIQQDELFAIQPDALKDALLALSRPLKPAQAVRSRGGELDLSAI